MLGPILIVVALAATGCAVSTRAPAACGPCATAASGCEPCAPAACGRCPPTAGCGSCATTAATVVRVVDGDTVILRLGGRRVRVRLIGVDAPETWSRHDCFGMAATRALRRLIPPGSTVRAGGDVEPYDRYRRRLLYLWTARGTPVDAALVRAGYARAMTVPPDTGHAAMLHAAENTARRSGAGLWRACAGRRDVRQ